MTYWRRTGAHTFEPTAYVGGSWDPATQHVASSLGVLAHEVVRDRDARRSDGLAVSRLSYDILGTMPIAPMEVEVRVLRPGRTIELVEATASCGGRVGVVLRAWLTAPHETGHVAGTDLPSMPAPDEMEPWPMSDLWPGEFIATLELRRKDMGPGRSAAWLRTDHTLVPDEEVSPLAQFATLLDVSNGVAVRTDPRHFAFPNLDLTAHLFREPVPGWVGLDTTVSFGANGVGLTCTVLHDEQGPLGTVAQTLTVRQQTG
ncbi:thioesterase family protein [Nocardioides campestrisoli]|uniref:thioesterase family protein n=1 Tax=Nocardioides campestrisoli TaxID=2736757 RepID=UPI00163DB394|nr:thioesterase family protein [Nocardioides campestrisoli]